MADRTAETVPAEEIRLADEPDFGLGAARVAPSTAEFTVGEHVERLEPRVMQVLVALARTQGKAVSRETLVGSCWGGRVVGQDAINRTLSTLRAIARRAPAPTFEIETLPRIGYRLKPAASAGEAPTAAAATAGRRIGRLAIVGLGTFGLMAAVVAAIVWGGRAGKDQDWDVASYRIAVGTGGEEMSPSLSPDGRFLAYAASGQEGGAHDIYMQAVAGGGPVLLVSSPQDDVAPAFSPSGDRIAFVRADADWNAPGQAAVQPCRILVKPVPAGPERLVGRCTESRYASRVAWTPDARALVFSDWRPESPARIVRLDVATGRKSPLTNPPRNIHGDFDAAVSPDGRTLAFRRYLSTQSGDIYLQDIDSGRLTRLTTDGGVGYLAWAPGGRNLIVSSERGGGHDLWRVPTDPRSRPQRLSWGETIYRTSSARDLAAFEVARQPSELMRIRGAVETPVVTGDRSDESPDVSPAGDLAFLNHDDGSSVWLQRRGGSVQKLLDLPMLDARGLRWSPDGRRLALLANPKGGDTAIYLIDTETAAIRQLPGFGPTPLGVSWPPDGESLVMATAEPDGRRIWRYPLRPGGRPEPISGFGWFWAEAGAGAVYALREGQAGVWRLAAGSPPVRLAPYPGVQRSWNRWNDPNWTIRVSGDRLHVWEPRADRAHVDHWTASLTGGRVEHADVLDGRLLDVTVDPVTNEMVGYRALNETMDIAVIQVTPKGRRRWATPVASPRERSNLFREWNSSRPIARPTTRKSPRRSARGCGGGCASTSSTASPTFPTGA
jgi:Tol biopolymer transport system component/DNA-binding winged helix-turn-helix (wHTH) protein